MGLAVAEVRAIAIVDPSFQKRTGVGIDLYNPIGRLFEENLSAAVHQHRVYIVNARGQRAEIQRCDEVIGGSLVSVIGFCA